MKNQKPLMKKSVILSSIAVVTVIGVFLGRSYSDMSRQEDTREVWQNLSFITYPDAKTYFQKNGVDVNARGTDGQTFLMTAADLGLTETAKIMIEFGADVNAKDDKCETALQLARQSRHGEIVGILLKHGAR